MTQRRIDPTLYIQAADAFNAIAESSDRIGTSARSSVSGFARMAGDDPGGEQFAGAYDDLAGGALQNIFDIGIRANSMDRLFMASGANAAGAEASAAGLAFDAGSFPLRDARQPSSVAGVPSAFGGTSGGTPDAWEVVKDFVGMMWPNADTDQLDQAAAAWERIAGDVRALVTEVRQGDNSVASLDSAELVSARTEVSDFASDVGEVADLLEGIGGECTTYASDVRDAHNEVIQMLVQLAIEIAAGAAIGAALSVFTFGGAGVVAGGAIALRIAAVGSRIISILIRVGGTAARVAIRIRAIRASLIPLANNFRRTAQAAISITSGTSAAVVSEVAVKGRDANLLVALASGLVGGGVTEAIASPFGRYGQHVLVQALAGGGGGAAGAAADGLISDGEVDIRKVIISGVGGAGFSGWGARGGSGRGGSASAADPGPGNVDVGGGEQPVPILTGNGPAGANANGGRTGSNDYEGPTVVGSDVGGGGDGGGTVRVPENEAPTVVGSDVGGSTGDGGGTVRVPEGEAPQSPSIEVTNPGNDASSPVEIPTAPTGPTNPVDLGTPGGTNHSDTPLFHDTESDLGMDIDGDGVAGTPTPASPESNTPLFHETESDLGMDVDGDGVTGTPASSGGVAPVGSATPVSPGGGNVQGLGPGGGSHDGNPAAHGVGNDVRADVEGDGVAGPSSVDGDEVDTSATVGPEDAAAGGEQADTADVEDAATSAAVPPHTDLPAPPPHQAADAPQLPEAEIQRINDAYRLPNGEVDPARLDEWAEAVSDAYPALTPDQVRGIYDYTTNPGYDSMNPYLRDVPGSTPADTASLETRITNATEGLANLPAQPTLLTKDQLAAELASGKTGTDGYYSRGVKMFPEFLDQFQVGRPWSDPSFMSSSNNPAVADNFAREALAEGKTPGIITIDGATPSSITPLSRYQNEAEYLFQRGTPFEVVTKFLDSQGIWRIHLREVE